MGSFINKLAENVLNPTIRLLFAVAIIYFLYGVVDYVRNANSDTGRTTGARHIMWGLVGLFIMISVYGIIRVLLGTLRII